MDFDLEDGLRRLADETARGTVLPVDLLGRRLRRRRAARTATITVVGATASVALVTGGAALLEQVRRPDVAGPVGTPDATPTVATTPSAPPPRTALPTPAVTTAPAPTVPPEPTTPAPPPPPSREMHGSTAWAVYAAVSSSWDDPALAAADARLTAMGYTGLRGGSLACDQGAAEALGRSAEDAAMAVYFDTPADAALFVELYGEGVVGTVEVTLFCRD